MYRNGCKRLREDAMEADIQLYKQFKKQIHDCIVAMKPLVLILRCIPTKSECEENAVVNTLWEYNNLISVCVDIEKKRSTMKELYNSMSYLFASVGGVHKHRIVAKKTLSPPLDILGQTMKCLFHAKPSLLRFF